MWIVNTQSLSSKQLVCETRVPTPHTHVWDCLQDRFCTWDDAESKAQAFLRLKRTADLPSSVGRSHPPPAQGRISMVRQGRGPLCGYNWHYSVWWGEHLSVKNQFMTQLTLEQHRSELHRSTYTQIFHGTISVFSLPYHFNNTFFSLA